MSPQESKKEKREAARQARIEAQQARLRAKKRKRNMGIAFAVLIALAAGAFGFKQWQEGSGALKRAMNAAGCTEIKEVKELEASPHLEAGAPDPTYNSNPPSSGKHLGNTAPWGAQDETIDKKLLVHNLEHGGVIIHYTEDIDAEDQIQELVDSFPDGVISQPNEDLDKPLGIAAWGRVQTCEKYDETVVKAFIKERCNKGPEKLGLRCG
ncbi:MAG TPA: DUF3105 domain-containing protein [Actinomycetota bacterium]|nr:DUF3105 domain-containing protein [Actinomycetota bacterium]